MDKLTKSIESIKYIFVPSDLSRAFEEAVIDWYDQYCEFRHGIPRPVLLSPKLADVGKIYESDEIMLYEQNLSWVVGSVIDRENNGEGATLLDTNITERMSIEADMRTFLKFNQMVYTEDNEIIINCPIVEVW